MIEVEVTVQTIDTIEVAIESATKDIVVDIYG